jgi:hypothetical protein
MCTPLPIEIFQLFPYHAEKRVSIFIAPVENSE